MIQATTRLAVFSVSPTLPTERIRKRTSDTTKPIELPLSISAETKDGSRMEDALSFILLCTMAATVLVATTWMAQYVIDSLLRFNSLGLMRGFAGM